jgi:hypothetical protein
MTMQCQKPGGHSINTHYSENLKMQAFALKNMFANNKFDGTHKLSVGLCVLDGKHHKNFNHKYLSGIKTL